VEKGNLEAQAALLFTPFPLESESAYRGRSKGFKQQREKPFQKHNYFVGVYPTQSNRTQHNPVATSFRRCSSIYFTFGQLNSDVQFVSSWPTKVGYIGYTFNQFRVPTQLCTQIPLLDRYWASMVAACSRVNLRLSSN